MAAGTLYVVATPIGNLEDITARALRVLREVDVIAAEDTRRTARLLARYGITTRTISLREHNERRMTADLLARLKSGESIALVSDAGTPTVSDPGAHMVSQAIAQGFRVSAIPGPCAAVAALSVSPFATDSFTFLGFPPIRSKDRKEWFERLAKSGQTVIFYEAPHRILATLAQIQTRIGDIDIAVARELTKMHEELVVGPISRVLKGLKPQGEFTVVAKIGHTTEHASPKAHPEASALASEFGQITDSGSMTRRQAIADISRRHGISAREVYAAIETAKKSGS